MNETRVIAPLKSVKITNFRGIREETLPLHPQVTVLFGANAAGKTSFLDAIAIGLNAYGSRVSSTTGRKFAKSGDIRIPWKDCLDLGEKKDIEQAYACVEIKAVGDLVWDVIRFRHAVDAKQARQQRNPISKGTGALHLATDGLIREALEAGNGRTAALSPPLPLVAAYGTERAVVEVPLRERDFKTEFGRLAALENSLQATTTFKKVFEWFRVQEDRENEIGKREWGTDYVLPELGWVRRAVEKAELGCHNPRVERWPIRMLVDFEHADGTAQPLDIGSLSDGYRTHFALVVDIARRMVQLNPSDDLDDPIRGTNTEAVILIDEVDLHLDPPWQSRVVRGLVNAFPRAQFILTTHSEQVIGSVEAACVRKLVWGDGEILVENVPFAQGATSERILIDLMGAKERVEGVNTDRLRKYQKMVDEGRGQTEEAKALRAAALEAGLPPEDTALHQADLEMRRQELARRFGGGER